MHIRVSATHLYTFKGVGSFFFTFKRSDLVKIMHWNTLSILKIHNRHNKAYAI